MADEQYIYLSADEDVTSVRERLQKIPNRRIVLVVPSETQLRSHISWRLLHSSARDLGKDVLIISADRQIRSVVKAAGFKAADQQGSPATTKSRGSSNPGRFGLGGKTSPRLQTPPVKGPAPQQSAPPVSGNNTGRSVPPVMGNSGQQRTPPVKGKMPIQGSPPVQGSRPVPDTNVPRSAEPWLPQNDQMAQQYDNHSWPQQDSTATGGIRPPFSSTFDPDEYSLGPASLILPLASTYQDEEPDLYLEDIHYAQSLREAAQSQDANTAIPSSEHTVPPITDLSTTQGEIDDPLSHMTDDHPASLPEQRGSVIYHEPGEDVHDIADESTDVLHIEDLGDNDDEFFHRTALLQGTPRVHSGRPHTRRTGSMRPSQSRPLELDPDDVK
ncbi:MAG TPA: hypothetical protein VIY29_20525, partial [Ktedonobacteraceae bacterium]